MGNQSNYLVNSAKILSSGLYRIHQNKNPKVSFIV